MTDVEVNKEDIEAVEKEVLAKDKAKEEELKAQIESKLRKQMEDEKKKQEEADRVKQLEESNKAMEAMLKEKEIQLQKQIEEIKANQGSSKAIHTQDPIQKQPEFDANRLDSDQMKNIDDDSEVQFMEHYGLPKNWRR